MASSNDKYDTESSVPGSNATIALIVTRPSSTW